LTCTRWILNNAYPASFICAIRISLVICKIRGTNEEFKGLSKNLSYTGLQFATSKHLKEGAELDVTLKIPGGIPQPPLKAIFAIKRINKQAGDQFIVSGNLRDVK
jgi:hypothetical protein